MPGASLWLIPPQPSNFNQVLQTHISKTVPAHFGDTKTHGFIPHVTVTSQIDSGVYGEDPQAWLGSLQLDQKTTTTTTTPPPFVLSLELLEPGEPFFKKLTVRVEKSSRLLELAATCRAEGVLAGDRAKAAAWVREEYLPHLSLMYAEIPASVVQERLAAIEEDCHKATRSLDADEEGVVARGGSLVLVDTTKPIDQWHIIAERDLPRLVWTSPWSKSPFDS